ncbi:TonB-dependent receptor [Segetibacter sp. 3557_3]|uniref:SusC/RagA family TonB-linked outer membrane protein n=1 Tax=Segetibacter sp. 3557_3 TaxID=2547429 RepID=UPI001058B567|nr:TonB-dependent receptor [Segetibacter sp. 3557_3]TDH24080.1 TonB-dependent receptor [Segetibacter sp. 3557_3]
MRRVCTLILMIALLWSNAFAQNRVITGIVSDDKGNPLENASVVPKGRPSGSNTDQQGKFSLAIPGTVKTLVITSVGFTMQEVSVTAENNYTVVLRSSTQSLDEVVVVAYGTARKGAVTGSIAQLSAKDLEQRPLTNVVNALAGAAPGIQLTSGSGQPGEAATVRIRGFGSVNASNNPLYVVDGVPYDYNIGNLNSDDIETISVLKDASASSLYGARAANGVIQITTKKGKKDRTRLQVSIAQGSVMRGIEEYDRVNAFQYYPLMWEGYRNSLVYPATGALPIDSAAKIASGLYPRFTTGANAGLQNYQGRAYSDISQLLGYNPFNVPRTEIVRPDGSLNSAAQLLYPDDLDWFKDIERSGSRGDYSVAVSGGTPKSDYYVSLGYTKEKGYVLNSDFERYTSRINLNTQPLNWFKTGLNLAGIVTKSNQGASDASSTGLVNPFYSSRIMGPIYPVFAHNQTTGEYLLDAKGERIYDLGSLATLGLPNRPIAGGRHALAETRWNQNTLRRNVLSARTYGEVSFLNGFNFRTNVAADFSNSARVRFENKIVGDGAPSGRGTRTNTNNVTMTINQLLTYNKLINKHSVDVLVGHENYDATYNNLSGQRTGQILDGNNELINFTTTSSLSSYQERYKIESYLSRLNYSFDNKYIFSASYRRDGTSRFSPESRWGDFWSVGASWRLSQEDFIKRAGWINELKLRASYGVVGNDDILDADGFSIYYAYQAFYELGRNNGAEPGFLQQSLTNPDLKWETNKTLDVAVDFAFFKNRLRGTLEYFDRRSDDLLFRVPLPVSSGIVDINRNVGAMFNKGIEVQLGGDVVRTKDFNWSLDLNWTTFTNQLTRLPQADIISGTKKLNVGRSLYDYWLRDWYGVDPNDGAGLYRSASFVAATSRISAKGDSVTTNQNNAQYHYAGSAIPDFYGSINSSLTYKNYGLSFLLNYQVGGLVYDGTYAQLMHSGSYGTALHTDILKRWQKPSDITDVPRMDNANTAQFGATSDRFLVDASYLSIRSLSLFFNLPAAVTSKAGISNARFYVSGENLYLFTKRKGLNATQSFTGVTSNVYTPSRIITAGINLSL